MSAARNHKSWNHYQERIRPVESLPATPRTDGPASIMERVSVDDIRAAGYQRRLDEGKVRRMVRDWDPASAGLIVLSLRESGNLYVIDGQHRVEAVRRLQGRVSPFMNAIVWEGLSTKDEVETFRKPHSPKM